MKKNLFIYFAFLFLFSVQIYAQIPTGVLVSIVKSEDERRFDKTLEDLLKNPNEKIRVRAALAAGRIGDEKAIPALGNLLEKDSNEVRVMSAFALGEIESAKASDMILKSLKDEKNSSELRARLTEAAGKIAAANAKDPKAIELGEAILDVLESEAKKPKIDRATVLLGLTAILRVRPAEGDFISAKFLTNLDARVRADAANTLSRLRAKNANEQLRAMLLADDDAAVRANAARALGAAEDKSAFDLLLEAAISDEDSRVRVSAIRSLGSLKDGRAADKLVERGENLLKAYKKSKFATPSEKSELLEIASVLGRLLPNTKNERALELLDEFIKLDVLQSPEISLARLRIAPGKFSSNLDLKDTWQELSTLAQVIGEYAALEPTSEEVKTLREESPADLVEIIQGFPQMSKDNPKLALAFPDVLRAFAKYKTEDLADILRENLKSPDVFVRAAAVELLGDLPPEQIKFGDFEDAFRVALEDERYDDALSATIEAIGKQKTERSTDFLKDRLLYLAKLNPKYGSSKYLARRRIIQLLKEKGGGDFSDKLGVVGSIFTNADYTRAVSRRNARAVFTTDKGTFTIEFSPQDAPLTVENFIKLAKSKYFDGLMIHRVVPNFVMQDGDPRGDGNGGPGYSIRCELNMLEYERGAVGMALSGKDTGGSQWFVTHTPSPHLDGGYTVFGKVNETDMKVVDNLVRGDKILTVKIIEGNSLPQKRK